MRLRQKSQLKFRTRRASRPIEVVANDGGGNCIIKTAASIGYRVYIGGKFQRFDTNLGRAEYTLDCNF